MTSKKLNWNQMPFIAPFLLRNPPDVCQHPIMVNKYINEMINLQQNQSQIRPQEFQLQSQSNLVANLESDIFNYLRLSDRYQVHEIPVTETDVMKTVFIGNQDRERVFYLGHGFGGSSYLYFPLFHQLLEKGNIVLWQIRGMGLNAKRLQYPDISQATEEDIENFYHYGLLKVLQYYNHKKIVFISHSFGAYITMKFAIKNQAHINIQKCILLSSIGVTPGENDYKNRCKNFKDVFYHALSYFTWKFNLTYKSALRRLHGYLKKKLLRSFLSKFQLKGEQLYMAIKIFDVLTSLKGGSAKYFYRTFLPRVLPLPHKSIQEIIENHPVQFETVFVYGGKSDWVDKKGSRVLEARLKKIKVKKLQNCGHMLPLHVPALRILINEELQQLK